MKTTFSILLCLCVLFCGRSLRAQDFANDPGAQLQKFGQFYRYLNGAYVDSVKNQELVESAIREMLLQLDPHSTYLTKEEMDRERESFDGSFSGIGVEFNVLKDTIIVVNVIAGGPSEKVGILPNDRIVGIDGNHAVGTSRADVPKLLRGPKGSKVDVKVIRSGVREPIDFTIVRDNIPINTIDASYRIEPGIGYIKVNRFANNTYKEFVEAFESLGKIDALILDLRGNGGGLLDQAILLSNFFLPQGSVIVSTEGMRVPPERVNAPYSGPFTQGKVIVLTNETSASGSEIVAGAIQDWDRGVLIGRRTFGKGLVQRQFPLLDGSALRLTIARYHTPTGRVIQRPYENGQREAYYEDLAKRIEGDSIQPPTDSTQIYYTLRSGRTVYGGGGITPDIIVEADTSGYTEYWANLIRRGVINEFILRYMDRNRGDLLARYPRIETFVSNFTVGDDILEELVATGEEQGVARVPEEFARSKREIRTLIKALIAQKLWGMNEYYRVVNSEGDEMFTKALEVLHDWGRYSGGIIE